MAPGADRLRLCGTLAVRSQRLSQCWYCGPGVRTGAGQLSAGECRVLEGWAGPRPLMLRANRCGSGPVHRIPRMTAWFAVSRQPQPTSQGAAVVGCAGGLRQKSAGCADHCITVITVVPSRRPGRVCDRHPARRSHPWRRGRAAHPRHPDGVFLGALAAMQFIRR